MSPLTGRTRLAVQVFLVVAVIAALVRLATVDYHERISTNVMDLLPADEQVPELNLLRGLVDDTQARVVRVVLSTSGGGAPPREAVEAFLATVRGSPAIADAGRLHDTDGRARLGRFLFEHRFEYLLAPWLEERRREFDALQRPAGEWPDWLAAEVAQRLETFLARPESGAYEEFLSSDPLLLLPELVRAMEAVAAEPRENAPTPLWVRSVASPLAEAGQSPVFDALEAAAGAARLISHDLEWRWTGVHRFAAASKERIRAELSWINAAALVIVISTVCLLVRRPWQTLHLLPIVLLSVLAAWVAVIGWFERVHVLVFVLGALLSGAAVDYGLHLGVHASVGKPWRTVLKPLLASCLTTVLGFALLGAANLPLLQQLSVFICSGLLGAVVAAILYVAQQRSPGIEPREFSYRTSWRSEVILMLGILLSAAGMLRIEWRDDVRDLQIDDADLRHNDAAIRAAFGEQPNRPLYLVHADDAVEARAQLERFEHWHRREFPETRLIGVALLWPGPRAIQALPETLATLHAFPSALREALEERDFVPDAFQPFFEAWNAFVPQAPSLRSLELWQAIEPELPQVLRDTVGIREDVTWLTVATAGGPSHPPPPEFGVTTLNRLESLNDLFRRYRHEALRLSLTGLGALGFLVIAMYGFRKGPRVFIIPAASTAVAFGLLGWSGQPLNLFHLLGAFLGVCLSHDYAIFGEAHRAPGDPAPASVRISAVTTAGSFGVLAFSQINAVASLGITVTLIVLTALLIVEIRSRRT